jgi:carboxyl-terminal processing protease
MPPVQITRQQVRVYSVSEIEMVDSTVGYIKLEKFAQSSTQEVDEALWQLHRQGMQSLIIDLRGNPGGLLTTAVELSDKFLPGGTIVSTRGRTQQDQMMETAEYAQTWSVPLVVLIDENSASASEIFAAAIQENNRGLVVGRTSYGKGTVQTHFPLRSVSGHLKLTTAKFYSPKGREMAGAGVTPDQTVHKAAYRPGDLAADYDRDIEVATEVARGSRVREIAQIGGRTGQPGNSLGSGIGEWIGNRLPGGR